MINIFEELIRNLERVEDFALLKIFLIICIHNS